MKYGVAFPYMTPRVIAKLSQLAEESGWDVCFLEDTTWCQDLRIGLPPRTSLSRTVIGQGAYAFVRHGLLYLRV